LAVDHSPGDELFDLDPSEFVAARDRLARQLKADGDGGAAATVKALRRPSVGAWAVNQVARRQPELVAAVVDAGRALAAALDAGDRDELRRATSARRDAVRTATRAAVDLAGEAHRDDIAGTFDAVVGDEEVAAEVVAGRLTRGRRPSAVFSPLGEVSLDEPEHPEPEHPEPDEPERPAGDPGPPLEVELPLTEHVVLALIAEGTTHGWAVAKLLEPEGEVGRVWTVRRALVYRAVALLLDAALVEEAGEEPSERGPRRTLLRTTDLGGRAAAAWLRAPVAHVRDLRTELLVKLLLAGRAGVDVTELVRDQRALLVPQAKELERRLRAAEGFDEVLLGWRVEATAAALRFLDRLQ
jgi:DNA-binding PadR family transcriptional regulator